MRDALDRLVGSSAGAFAVLTLAACLEVAGDACFQTGLYRAAPPARVLWFAAAVVLLGIYGYAVNLPRWDFGRLLGVYVAMFFVVAQVVARVRFGQAPTVPVLAGGTLIVAGGLLITFWQG